MSNNAQRNEIIDLTGEDDEVEVILNEPQAAPAPTPAWLTVERLNAAWLANDNIAWLEVVAEHIPQPGNVFDNEIVFYNGEAFEAGDEPELAGAEDNLNGFNDPTLDYEQEVMDPYSAYMDGQQDLNDINYPAQYYGQQDVNPYHEYMDEDLGQARLEDAVLNNRTILSQRFVRDMQQAEGIAGVHPATAGVLRERRVTIIVEDWEQDLQNEAEPVRDLGRWEYSIQQHERHQD